MLYIAVQAFNVWTLASGLWGISLVIRDDSYRNSVMYGALVVTAAILLFGLRVAKRIRLRFVGPS